jgi:pimeloyl-ACP methyl ester carboxylesterase
VNSLGALILVECTPQNDLPSLQCPVLLVCGRQSSRIRHEKQVAAFERLEHGRIVELESCGDDPMAEQPEQLAETVRWFLSTL